MDVDPPRPIQTTDPVQLAIATVFAAAGKLSKEPLRTELQHNLLAFRQVLLRANPAPCPQEAP